ncbi:MAG: transporter [Betaproteobacteria bacterium]|nr:transporter [Betaproteobacteria bacterium]MDE2056444.1 transporter [Betaproteobacteria bacterium]
MWSLNSFRHKSLSAVDLLPWAGLVAPGVILTKGGGYLASWRYQGPDLDSANAHEMNWMANHLNQILALDEGWIIHCDVFRIPADLTLPAGSFPDATTELIEAVRQEGFKESSNRFINDSVLTLTWYPPVSGAHHASLLFMEKEKEGEATYQLNVFTDKIKQIEDRLSSVLQLTRLQEYEINNAISSHLINFLNTCVQQEKKHITLPEIPFYLDSIIGLTDIVTGFMPKINNIPTHIVSLEGYPAFSYPGMMDFLSRQELSYRWSSRFIYLSQENALKTLNGYRARWSQKRKSAMNVLREQAGGEATHINHDADDMSREAIAAITEVNSGLVRYGYYTSVLILSHPNEQFLVEQTRLLIKLIHQQGVGVRLENINAMEAWLGSMPGNHFANVRRPLINTLNLCHLLPFTSIWAGSDTHPNPLYPHGSPPLALTVTTGATPFRFNLHAEDVGHTAIIGPTGAGKSTLLCFIMAQQFRYPYAQVFVFDKGYSSHTLVLSTGGVHHELKLGGHTNRFCPLAFLHEQSELSFAQEWIELLCELQGVSVNAQYREEIYRVLKEIQLGSSTSSERTLTHFVTLIQYPDLRQALRFYTLQGVAGELFDGETDHFSDHSFQVFEMDTLMQYGDAILLPTLTYLFHRLLRRFDGRPTLLILDEAWIVLDHPRFRLTFREWLKTLRKRNVAVIFATQSISDLNQSGLLELILESCPTKILLPNREANTPVVKPLYEKIGLNDRQILIISQAIMKRQYYMIQPKGKRLFELGLSEVELTFLSVADKKSREHILELQEKWHELWPFHWLQEHHFNEAAQHWLNYHDQIH